MALTDGLSSISALMSHLSELENEYEGLQMNSDFLQDHISCIKRGLSFLACFLKISFGTRLSLKLLVRHMVDELSRELGSISNQQTKSSITVYELESSFANLRGKLSRLKAEDVRHIVWRSIFPWTKNLTIVNDLLIHCSEDLALAHRIAELMTAIEDLKQKLKLLKPLFTYLTAVQPNRAGKRTLKPIFLLLYRALFILYSCSVEKMDEDKLIGMKAQLRDLLQVQVKDMYMMGLSASLDKIEVGGYGCELLENVVCFLHCHKMHLNYQSKEFHKDLISLQILLENLQREMILENTKKGRFRTAVETLTWKAIPILYSCNVENVQGKEGVISEVCDQLKHIQAEFGVLKLHNCPKTDALGFLKFFCSYLEELQESRPQDIEALKSEIVTVHVDFNILKCLLVKTKQPREPDGIWDDVVSLAYDVIYVIDFFLAYGSNAKIKPSLSRIIEQIGPIKMEVLSLCTDECQEIEEDKLVHSKEKVVEKITSTSLPQATVVKETDFVGFKDEMNMIIETLVHSPKELGVVSIVGMPGIGKTTLARKLYEDSVVKQHFDVQVWCIVSQTYRKTELWENIYCQVNRSSDIDSRPIGDDDWIGEKIAQSLKRRRYLIIIDDIWDIKPWNELKRCLPNDENGSRVIVTTRHHYVAEHTASELSNVQSLRLFTESECLELFERKLGSDKSYSLELQSIIRQIALSCKGLPLAISVIAGHLLNVEKSIEKWGEVAKSLSFRILNNPEGPYKAVIEWSYNYLPDHLKRCFLYTGVLGTYKDIPAWKLKLLWIAEGFVSNTLFGTLERQAEEYLMNLISRSLLTPVSGRTLGGVKACRIHDLLRDFCLEKSEEESFMYMINADGWPEVFQTHSEDKVKIWSRGYDFQNCRPSGSGHCVRSLLYVSSKLLSYPEYETSFVSVNFKLLRVLDMGDIDISNCFDIISLLTHLRYLAIRALLTSSIFCLRSLQTLIVNSPVLRNLDVVDVPDTLWDMVNLRVVRLRNPARFQIVEWSRLENSPFPENMETLSTACFPSAEIAEKILRRLPKLRKLSFSLLDCWGEGEHNNCQFPVLNFLTELVSLKYSWEGPKPDILRHEFHLPPNIKKLTLFGSLVSWDEISNIGRELPNLTVLKIYGSDYGGTWSVGDEDFPNLRCLILLKNNRISEWIASEDSFPKLEKLSVGRCMELFEIPPHFGLASSLMIITLKRCPMSLYHSARTIRDQQKEVQNEEFEILSDRDLDGLDLESILSCSVS